jgi:7-keto-8-aminopelargonate synthetase-like enzyme
MSGEICKLPEIVTLAKKYGARVMVDDAHGLGVLGKCGRGTAEHFDLEDEVDIIMGTFSKSLASLGGYMAASKRVIDYVTKSDSLILDFFSGSATTAHAVMKLNAEDGGKRRCIMVTNNEMSGKESDALLAKGIQPGSSKWNYYGIARYVTWPRTVCSIKGTDVF